MTEEIQNTELQEVSAEALDLEESVHEEEETEVYVSGFSWKNQPDGEFYSCE